MNLRLYLQELGNKPVQDVSKFVLGNSSVDYDTFFGSIIFAFLLTASTKKFHMPIIDCKHQQLKFRFEISQVLNRLKIQSSIFKYKDSFPLIPQGSFYSLYDHNVRPGITNVEYIVDHHDYVQVNARKYLISRMGSALTHIYYIMNPKQVCLISQQNKDKQTVQYQQKFIAFMNQQPFSEPNYFQDQQLILQQIIRYGILLDTFNLDQKQRQRWTIFDKRALQSIQSRKNYLFGYKQLEQLKFNEELNKKLTLEQALVKDYKKFDYCGLIVEYSIIYLQPKQFYQHYKQQMQKVFEQKQSDSHIYMLMSVYKNKDNKLSRQVAYRIKNNDETHTSIVKQFMQHLNMQQLQTLNNEWYTWKDPKATISRKIFDKEFRNFYNQLSAKQQL